MLSRINQFKGLQKLLGNFHVAIRTCPFEQVQNFAGKDHGYRSLAPWPLSFTFAETTGLVCSNLFPVASK